MIVALRIRGIKFMTSPKQRKKKKISLKSNPFLKQGLAFICGMFMHGVRASWRVTSMNMHPEARDLIESGRPVIYALWHGRMYCLLKCVPQERVAILVSPSNDGDFITQMSYWLGYRNFIRGSQKRDRTHAAFGMYRAIKEQNLSVVFTVDGPRGPRYKVKPGIIRLAEETGAPIIPLGSSAAWLLALFKNSWDHFHAPFFFTPIHLNYGKPIYVPPDINDEAVAQYCQELEEALLQINLQADEVHGFRHGERL
jgi:lysophospholipid acyltransferase (LPLAT)-like uncharacterized protein